MSHSPKPSKGLGEYIGDYYRVIKGDTRSLDYSSYIGLRVFGCLGFKGLYRFPTLSLMKGATRSLE